MSTPGPQDLRRCSRKVKAIDTAFPIIPFDPHRLAWFGGVKSDMGELGGGAVNDGRWHHVVGVTVAATRSLLFIDGELVKSGGPETAKLGNSG